MYLFSPFFLCLLLPLSALVYARLPVRARPRAICVLNLFFCIAALGKRGWLLPLFALAVWALSIFPAGYAISVLLAAFFLCRAFFPVAGLSFFLPRALLFLREKKKRRLFEAFACLCFFPVLPMGPILPPSDFSLQTPTAGDARRGIWRLSVGLCKKLWLADGLFRTLSAFGTGTCLSAWMRLVSFALYLYFDFSGYSDAAVGTAALFGVRLPENFDFPYAARSVGEFFRRWHASLGQFFFTSVYLPLGGSRRGRGRTLLALAAVWLCTALWHGAKGNYLLWGVWFFLLSAAEKCLFPRKIRLGWAVTLLCVLFGWVFFLTDTPREAFVFFAKLFCMGNTLLYTRADFYPLLTQAPFLCLGAFFTLPVLRPLRDPPRAVVYTVTPLLWMIAAASLAAGGHQPLLYARY